MLQKRINIRGMNTLDYILLGGGATCLLLALGDLRIAGNDLIFIGIGALCIWFAFDGVKATWKDLAAIVLLLVMGLLLFANLEPYVAAAYFLFGNKLPEQVLSGIPFIGGAWAYLSGGLVLAIVVGLEIYPTILKSNRDNLKRTIDILMARAATSSPDPNLSAELAALVKEYENFELNTYLKFEQFRIYAYIFDFIMISLYYPPLIEGWEALKWGWPRIEDLNWQNIVITLVILLGLQSIVTGYLWIRNVNEIFIKEQP